MTPLDRDLGHWVPKVYREKSAWRFFVAVLVCFSVVLFFFSFMMVVVREDERPELAGGKCWYLSLQNSRNSEKCQKGESV